MKGGGVMGRGGRPPSPFSTSCGLGVGGIEIWSVGCLLTRSQSEFRARKRCPRPSMHLLNDWRRKCGSSRLVVKVQNLSIIDKATGQSIISLGCRLARGIPEVQLPPPPNSSMEYISMSTPIKVHFQCSIVKRSFNIFLRRCYH